MKLMTTQDKITGNIFRNNLYSTNNIPELERNIGFEISEQFDSSDFLMQSLASQLIIASNIRRDAKCFHDIANQLSKSCFNILVEYFPELLFFISIRGKSLISELHKRYEKVLDGNNPIAKDLIAIRIIILNDTNQEILKKCYQIFYKIISLLTRLDNDYLDFPLVVSEPDRLVTKTDFDAEKFSEIILPNKDIIPKNFERIAKDYMQFPKDNGYQSLHGSFEIPSISQKYAGLNLEIQIRTLAQHRWAEFHEAAHSKYKESRNEKMDQIFYFDPNKVHITGFSPDFDIAGLQKPLHLCQISKTF